MTNIREFIKLSMSVHNHYSRTGNMKAVILLRQMHAMILEDVPYFTVFCVCNSLTRIMGYKFLGLNFMPVTFFTLSKTKHFA